MTPLESYLADLLAVRGTGTAETSGYPALANLLNEVGGALKPKITAIIHPANSGAGLPDGGFFSAAELRKHPDETSLLELKAFEHDLLTSIECEFAPALRKQFGVWYTPPEIVKYMVARVDRALRNDLVFTDKVALPKPA